MVRIAIDARRKINSGIGRVSQWLAHNMPSLIGDAEPIYIVSRGGHHAYGLYDREIIETDISPFSAGEAYYLPDLIASTGANVYVNPQTTWSPFHCVKSINIIHDLWAIFNPEWLPTEDDLKSRFGIDDIHYFRRLGQWFTLDKAKRLLTSEGFSLYRSTLEQGNPISIGVWAQYAATVEYSAATITVSEFIKQKLSVIFPRGTEAIVIPNVPKDFIGGSFQNIGERPRQHFITLSKLERRKNLDTLLEAYVSYAKTSSATVLPLIIAGDPGYKSIALDFATKVDNLRANGFLIEIRNSISDKELKELFANAAALIFPTHFEGFGLPPLEAMLAGVEVIATRTGMMDSHLGKYARLVSPNDIQQLSDELHNAANSTPDPNKLLLARKAVQDFVCEINPSEIWSRTILDVLNR